MDAATTRPRETVNAFAGNPIAAAKRDPESLSQWLRSADSHSKVKVLPLVDGKPLVAIAPPSPSPQSPKAVAPWRLAWQALDAIPYYSASAEERIDHLVYLGDGDGFSYFAISAPVKDLEGDAFGQVSGVTFCDVRSLMQTAEIGDREVMGELAIAGHARALLEWHKQALFCGRCGTSTRPILCGQRRQCTNDKCKTKLYPRIDPVVIMLVIDRAGDRAILGRQSRFVPRMWSCLAGFIEPGESLEEAVRRETREEVGIEVGDIVYHSSQPWPVGPSSMPCQLMVGFFAYAKSFDIRVDGKELEDAQWHRREDIRNILQNSRHRRDQQETIVRIQKAASGDAGGNTHQSAKTPSIPKDAADTSSAVAFVPGPYAIAHHLISTWANQGPAVLAQSNY